jgi:hypothetical protein
MIGDIETDIEIDFEFHKQPEVDWHHFESFFKFISEEGRLKQLIDDSVEHATIVGQVFFSGCLEAIADWKMEFSGLYYNGKANDPAQHAYNLLYNFIVRKGTSIDGDAYGCYLIDMEDLDFVDARRIQV